MSCIQQWRKNANSTLNEKHRERDRDRGGGREKQTNKQTHERVDG
jgi:hypothetical protein